VRYDAVLFDMDGTVVDSLADITDAVNYAMRHFGMAERTPEQVRSHLGNGARRLLAGLLPDAAEAFLEEMLACYLPYYAVHTGDRTRPYDGILPLMEKLKAAGIRLAILSNKPDAAVQPLVETYFAGLVELAVGERAGVRRKPAPDMIDAAANALGVDRGRCLYVGDSEVDVATAANAGIDCAAVTWGYRSREELLRAGAKTIIDRPEELLRCVEG